jgi:hypothetical protein
MATVEHQIQAAHFVNGQIKPVFGGRKLCLLELDGETWYDVREYNSVYRCFEEVEDGEEVLAYIDLPDEDEVISETSLKVN